MINVVSASRLKQLGIKRDHSITGVRCFKVSKFTQSQMARSYSNDSVVDIGDHHNVNTQLSVCLKGFCYPVHW